MNRTGTQSKAKRRMLLAVRMVAFMAAVALGVVGVWMIVTGSSTKAIRVGAIASFWALLLGAFAVLGSRVPGRDVDHTAEPPPQRSVPSPPPRQHGGLDRRHVGDIERAAVGAARREFQAGVQDMLRREVAAAVSREFAGLRSEVAALRNELVEKVGGQIRLERIETTRLIGSDLEALQREVRQLRRSGPEADANRAMRIAHPLEVRADPDQDVHDAEIVVERVHPPAPPAAAARAESGVGPSTVRGPHPPVPPRFRTQGPKADPPAATAPAAALWQPAPQRTPQRTPPPTPQWVPQPPAQPLAQPPGVPPQPPAAPTPQQAPHPTVQPSTQPSAQPSPQPSPQPTPQPTQPAAAAARSSTADAFAGLPRIRPFTEFPLDMIPSTAGERGMPARGRRHRPDDSDNDVLARILARERGR